MATFNWVWIIIGLLGCLWTILAFKVRQIDDKLDKNEFERRMQSLEARHKEDKEDLKCQINQLKQEVVERISTSEAAIKDYIGAIIASRTRTSKKE